MHQNKTILITGASSGIGRALAQRFLEEGANLVVNARRADKLEELANAHADQADRLRMVAGDISVKETSLELARVALDQFGRIDCLINNAGAFVPKPFLEGTEEDLDSYYATTVKGAYFAAQAVIPAMQKQRDGSIINIGSMWVEHPLEATPCSASQVAKGGMHTLTRHLAIEFAKDNIRANTIAPAVIETPLYDKLMDPETLQSLAALHPLRRLGQVEDITSWALNLVGEGGRFVTGQTLHVDGGITAGAHAA